MLAALALVWTCGPRFPYQDDFALVTRLTGAQPFSLQWLWKGYNDHRYALSFVLLFGTHKLSGGEHRAAMSLEVLLLAAAAAVMLLALRRVRGRASAWDAALPLAALHWGHWWNLLMSFQLWLVLSTALLCTWIAGFASGGPRLSTRLAVLSALTLAALPLLAGSGALSTPPLAVAALAIALWIANDTSRGPRAAALVLALGALAALAIFAAYIHGFQRSFHAATDDRLSAQLGTFARFVSLALGPSRWQIWQPAAVFALALGFGTAGLLVRELVLRPAERARALALLGALGALAALAIGIAWGRTAPGAELGLEVRYVTLLLPLTPLAYFAWELYGPVRSRGAVRAVLAALTLLGVANGTLDGWRGARELRGNAARFEADVASGLDSAELAGRHVPWMFPKSFDLARFLAELRRAGLPPFDRGAPGPEVDATAVGPFTRFNRQPDSGVPAKRILAREHRGREVATIGEPGELAWRLRGDERSLSARFGLLPESAKRSDGVVFAVELRASDGSVRVLFERAVDPLPGAEEQPEHELALELPAGAEGELALVTRNLPGRHERWDRCYWADVTLR